MSRDAHALLLRALGRLAGPDAAIVATRSRPWASATFAGSRHSMTLALSGDHAAAEADRLARALPEAEFRLPGHLVADLSVTRAGDDAHLLIEALTVEEV